jgi:hypothetical protein
MDSENAAAGPSLLAEDLDPAVHHHIAAAENNPQHIGTFLQTHSNDPATKVSAGLNSLSSMLTSEPGLRFLWKTQVSFVISLKRDYTLQQSYSIQRVIQFPV